MAVYYIYTYMEACRYQIYGNRFRHRHGRDINCDGTWQCKSVPYLSRYRGRDWLRKNPISIFPYPKQSTLFSKQTPGVNIYRQIPDWI